jgi:hypothetical protein
MKRLQGPMPALSVRSCASRNFATVQPSFSWPKRAATLLDVTIVSSQLDRLQKEGIVEKVSK